MKWDTLAATILAMKTIYLFFRIFMKFKFQNQLWKKN